MYEYNYEILDWSRRMNWIRFVFNNLQIVVRVIDVKYLLCVSFSVNRGFGFITFADPASVDKVLAQGNHELDGKKVSIRNYCTTKNIFLEIEEPRNAKYFYLCIFFITYSYINVRSRMYTNISIPLKFFPFPIIAI